MDKQVLRFYIFYRRRPYLAWRPIVSFSSVGMLIIAALAYVIVQRGQDSGAWPLLLGVLFGALFVNAWYVTKSGTVVPLFSRIIDYQRVDQILEQGGYETADDTAEDTAEEDV